MRNMKIRVKSSIQDLDINKRVFSPPFSIHDLSLDFMFHSIIIIILSVHDETHSVKSENVAKQVTFLSQKDRSLYSNYQVHVTQGRIDKNKSSY